MVNTANGFPRISADRVERFLAILLIGLLGLYGLGRASSGVVPVLDTVGVLSVHLAVVVAGVFPIAVLGHAADSRIRSDSSGPRLIEVGTAVVGLVSLVAALWLSLDMASGLATILLGCATVALLVLTGLVAGRS